MEKAASEKEVKPQAAPIREDRTFHDLLESLLGQVVTVVNPNPNRRH